MQRKRTQSEKSWLQKTKIMKNTILAVCILSCITAVIGGYGLSRHVRSDHSLNSTQTTPCNRYRGRDGRDGLPGVPGRNGVDGNPGLKGETGVPGPSGSPGPHGKQELTTGGVVYTRWGKSTCPNVPGTELVYTGIAGGTYYNQKGGGGNYLCMPYDPEYDLPYVSGVRGHAYIHGGEYDTPIQGHHDHNVPCAVCAVTSRIMMMMIPAKATCPSSWTREYYGYIMTSYHVNSRGRFECVDRDQESLPGSAADTNGFIFFHVEATCNGLPCPPYNTEKELNCVVCTK